jgi:hypothetical protein
MSSISSTNPGISNLLQTLSNINSPVLSSPSVLSALQKASPSDVVKLSTAALQLENVNALFGVSNQSSSSSTSALNSLLASLEAPPTPAAANTTAPTAASSTASPAEQAASYQASVQQSETQVLLGLGPTGASGSLFDMLG